MPAKTPKKVVFHAYLPPVQSAIMMAGDSDLMQAKLNINLSESPEALKLLLMSKRKLKVTVEILTDLDHETKKGTKRIRDRTGG